MDIKCRVCLASSEAKLYHPLDSTFPNYLKTPCTVLSLLQNITSSPVFLAPGYPNQICTACLKSLKECLLFVQEFKKAQIALNERVNTEVCNDKMKNSLFIKTEEEIVLKVEPPYEDPLQMNGESSVSTIRGPRTLEPKLILKPVLKKGVSNQKQVRRIIARLTNKKADLVKNTSTNESSVPSPTRDFMTKSNEVTVTDHTYTRDPNCPIKDYELDSDESISADDSGSLNNSNIIETIRIITTTDGADDKSSERKICVMSVNDVLNAKQRPRKRQILTEKMKTRSVKSKVAVNSKVAVKPQVDVHPKLALQPKSDPLQIPVKKKVQNNGWTLFRSGRAYRCRICSKVYTTAKGLNLHHFVHTPQFKEQLKCKHCGHQSQTKAAFFHHRRKHLGLSFGCDECDKTVPTPWQLREHKRRMHGAGLPDKFICSECGKRFKYNNALKYHIIATHHKEDKEYLCGFCGFKCVTQTYMKRHERCHTGERPYKCKFCPKTFRGAAELRSHHFGHEQKSRYHCKYCGKGFISSWNMKVHWSQHKGIYECTICQKSFVDTEVLEFHYFFRHKIRNPKEPKADPDASSMLENGEFLDDLIDKDPFLQ